MLFLVFLYVVYHVNVHTYGYSSFSAVCRGISTYGLTMPAVAFLRNRGNGLIHYLRALDALTLSHSLVAMRPPSFHSFRNDGGDNLLFKSLVSMASLLSSPSSSCLFPTLCFTCRTYVHHPSPSRRTPASLPLPLPLALPLPLPLPLRRRRRWRRRPMQTAHQHA